MAWHLNWVFDWLFQQGLHSASVPGILSLDLQDSDPSKAITGNSFSIPFTNFTFA